MTDYRAELQRLVKAYDEHGGRWPDEDVQALFQAVKAARTALAQPEPEGLTDEELLGCMLKAAASVPGGQCTGILDWDEEAIAAARAVIAADRARFGRSVIEPVPGAEVPPMPVPGDAEGLAEVFWGRYAQPEPEGVGDEELLRTYGKAKRDHCYEGPMDDWPKRAERAATVYGLRAVLTRYARPTIEPVPVSERPWEREGWCDAEGRCWWWCHRHESWELDDGPAHYRHSLPHNALPIPTP
jgi:hypothetical protein